MITGYILAEFTLGTATLSATTNAGGPTTVTLTPGTYTLATLAAHLQSALNAQRSVSGGAWTVAFSTTTGKLTIAVTAGVYSLSWTSTELRDLVGFTANVTSASTSTGANAARGIWIPDAPLDLEGDPRARPMVTDLRQTESPTGFVLGLVGNVKYRHRALKWGAVERHRVWAVDPTYPSWERFLLDAHLGQGHAWFRPCARMLIVDHTGQALGSDAGTVMWNLKGIRSVEPKKTAESWTGLWSIEVPEIVSAS